MEKEILHIFNGDVTKTKFRTTSIKGAQMVWRETLCLGPLFYQVDSEVFWEMRSQFVEKAYHSKLSHYKSKVIKEFQILKKFKGREIILWFEYDFFCQINMIALLSYLLRYKKEAKISLICVGEVPGYEKRVGLGEIASSLYYDLYKNRTLLSSKDLIIADKAWMIFCAKNWNGIQSLQYGPFEYLQEAMINGLKIHTRNNSLSSLEAFILKTVEDQSIKKRTLIGDLLRSHPELGLGDLQYEFIINSLTDYLKEDNGEISLSSKGKMILSQIS